MRDAGVELRGFLLGILQDHPDKVQACVDCVGTDTELPFSDAFLHEVREKLTGFYAQHGVE
eukprot:4319951-Amphidinium_carterae.1